LLSEINNGNDFTKSYFEIEKKARSKNNVKLPANPLRFQDLDKKDE